MDATGDLSYPTWSKPDSWQMLAATFLIVDVADRTIGIFRVDAASRTRTSPVLGSEIPISRGFAFDGRKCDLPRSSELSHARGKPTSVRCLRCHEWSYKGEFLLGNRQYCYPLPVTDHASRYRLCCEALSSTCEDYAFTVLERLFKERGRPSNLRSDNGVPFASAHAWFNLSQLAVCWLRLDIGIERIKPGHPQQNGRHERMPLTLKKETTKPAGLNLLQQQAKFDDCIQQRPHQALDMKCPAQVYQPSPRA